ncbi:ClpXP protease specificity-enhancing factor [Pseudomonadota bacterium]
MIPSRPYLIRALFEWLVDCELTPHLLVDAQADQVIVPRQYVKEGRIVLNISPGAVQDLELGNEMITFNARFGGVAQDLFVPTEAVLGIYARENGRGMLFPEEGDVTDDNPPDDEPPPPSDRPSLKIVK